MAITPPTKFAAIWANDESSSFLTQPIPTPTQTGGRASLNDGFPPICFVDPNGGGIPPDGRDFNGILYMLTAAAQFEQAGGKYAWDSALSTAIGGYPLGAVVAHATITGFYWLNTVANNTTNPDASGAGWTGFQASSQPGTGASFGITSNTVCTLSPKAGGLLWINGFNYLVPAGCTLSNSGLANGTLYYVYAKIAGGIVTLATSTTGYTILSNGIAVNSGDATLTLVGAVVPNASGFIDTDGARQVRSYWQRGRQVRSRTNFTGSPTTTNSALAELSVSIRNSFLVWAGENVQFMTSGQCNAPTSSDATTAVSFDGGSPEIEGCTSTLQAPVALNGIKVGLAEGLHFATLYGSLTGGGTATWVGGATLASAAVPVTLTLALAG